MAGSLFLTGCLGGGSDGGPDRDAIATTIQRLQSATARQDFATVCNDLMTASARRRAGGPDCARLSRTAAAGVHDPKIELEGVDLDGSTARVTVRTRAQGQPRLTARLVLRRENGGWRIDSLGD
jgi:hypothetical protein